jgi:hypothetical protein
MKTVNEYLDLARTTTEATESVMRKAGQLEITQPSTPLSSARKQAPRSSNSTSKVDKSLSFISARGKGVNSRKAATPTFNKPSKSLSKSRIPPDDSVNYLTMRSSMSLTTGSFDRMRATGSFSTWDLSSFTRRLPADL